MGYWGLVPPAQHGGIVCVLDLSIVLAKLSRSVVLPAQPSVLLPLFSQALAGIAASGRSHPPLVPHPLYFTGDLWVNHLNSDSVLAFASQGTVSDFDVLLCICHASPVLVNENYIIPGIRKHVFFYLKHKYVYR